MSTPWIVDHLHAENMGRYLGWRGFPKVRRILAKDAQTNYALGYFPENDLFSESEKTVIKEFVIIGDEEK